uniref:Uncharacterized protein n=1 Tax=Rhizophora mucronata TaxID=61149 RepID=A0A2P2QUB8_RHIMU
MDKGYQPVQQPSSQYFVETKQIKRN